MRLHSIHRYLQLRCFRQRVGASAGEQGTLAGLIEQSLLRGGQLRPRLAGAGLQIHVDAAELAQAANGGQVHHEDLSIGDAVQNLVCLRNELHGRPGTLAPILQLDEGHAHVFTLPDEAEALGAEYAVDVFADGAVFQRLAHLVHDLSGALQGCARGQVDYPEHEALILIGDEAGRQVRVEESCHHRDQCEDHHPARRMTHGRADMADVGLADPVESLVEPAECHILFLLAFVAWPQDRRAKRGSE